MPTSCRYMRTRNDTAHARNVQLISTWREGRGVEGSDPGARRRRRRAEHALASLLRENSPLVWQIVRQRRWGGLSDEELHAAGMVGLLRGLEKYDETIGCTLSTYATWWIRQAIGREAERWWKKSGGYLHPVEFEARIHEGLGGSLVDTEEAYVLQQQQLNLEESLKRLDTVESALVRTWLDCEGNTNETARRSNLEVGVVRGRLQVAWSKIQHPSNTHSLMAGDWEDAACRGQDVSLYFPGPGRKQRNVSCENCPRLTACQNTSINNPKLAGIWGGLGDGERKALRRNRRKTP